MPDIDSVGQSSPRCTLPRLLSKRQNLSAMSAHRRNVRTSSRRKNHFHEVPHTVSSIAEDSDDLCTLTAGEVLQTENGTPVNSQHRIKRNHKLKGSHNVTTALSQQSKDNTPSTSSGATIVCHQHSQSSVNPMPFRCFPVSKAKRVRFFRNGDQYYKGMWYAVSAERVRSFQALLADLTRAMCDAVTLPHGVRYVFALGGSQKITELDEFQDGESYVCSSSDTYKRVDYENAKEPTWCFALSRINGSSVPPLLVSSSVQQEPNDFVYPRIITIIRNGVKPRRVVRHLLNKRTARSFVQVVQDITAIVKLDSGIVRKLFTLSGKLVTCLADFFGDDDVFIAYGKERMADDDFYVVSEECKRLYGYNQRSRHAHQRNKLRHNQRKMPARNESLREDRSGSVVPDSEMSRTLPLELDDKLHVVKLIGDGNTALVYEVMCKKTRNRTALKVISRENAVGKEELIRSEIDIMRRISHEHIIQMYDCWQFDGAYYLSLELISGGDLFEHLCHVRQVDEYNASCLMRCLASALDYLHSNSVVHRDVKPENLLIYQCLYTGDLLLKLADFGLAVELSDEPLFVICGTPTYVAPEVLAEFGYDQKVDIWAAGVILYVLLCGFPPFQSVDGNQEQLFEQILQGTFSFPSPIWDSISYSAKGLIQGLLQLDVEERFSASQILDYPWIKEKGSVEEEYEKLMEAAVKASINSNSRRDEFSESGVEYFFSRRASMDELSECVDDDFQCVRRNSSFDFITRS
ncbi:hypothetical protein AB6A40_001563 [Gnathostoma spinigerum]|uniref:non-specific serine/threonine protein kinase n=1 Tax=Gnathostoma spinigerum TaxID=75299 RepID=A0ABD6EBY0_9BILA